MYIHPFVAGIIFTVGAEIVFCIALAIALSRNPRKDDKEKE
jgi:hypothetical protein